MASMIALSTSITVVSISFVVVMGFWDPLGLIARFGIWKILTVVFALLNLKNIPFVWHLRTFTAFVNHIWISPAPPPTRSTPSTLFQPSIIKCRNSLMDCDFNIHKSNSTYFADLDVARSQILPLLCRHGIAILRKRLVEAREKGKFGIMLGAVHCSFRREIKPLQGYEIWSRILTWDRKWLYVINHFVERDAVQPQGYTLQPWRRVQKRREKEKSNGQTTPQVSVNGKDFPPAPSKIFASSIAKYVFKAGRRTIPPIQFLEAGGLVPPKPSDVDTPSYPPTPCSNLPSSTSHEPALVETLQRMSSSSTDDVIEQSLKPNGTEDDIWDWQRVEDERARGMKLAEMFNSLDALEGEFRGGDDMALGLYFDPA